MAEVRAAPGVPTASAFAGLGAPTQCAPIVVDSTTGFAYTLKLGNTVMLLSSAVPVGVSGSFTTADAKTVTVTDGIITDIT